MKRVTRLLCLGLFLLAASGCMTHAWVMESKNPVGATNVVRAEAVKPMRTILIHPIETGSAPEELGSALQAELLTSFQNKFSGTPVFRAAASGMSHELPVEPFASPAFWQTMASRQKADGILFIKNQRYFEPGGGDRFEEWAIGFGSGVAQSNWRVSVFDGKSGELVWDREYIIGDSPILAPGAISTSNRNALKRFAQELAGQWPAAVQHVGSLSKSTESRYPFLPENFPHQASWSSGIAVLRETDAFMRLSP